MEEKNPKIGVGVIIKKGKKILFHKRKGSHGEGTWSFPGGHLEFNETLEQCAQREVEEESGIKIKNIKFAALTNDIFEKENKHYVTVFMTADHDSKDPEIKEPDRIEQWQWFFWNSLPKPLFLPIENLIKQGFNPFKDKVILN